MLCPCLGCPASSHDLLLFKTHPSASSLRSFRVVFATVNLFLFCHLLSWLWETSSWDQFELRLCGVCVYTCMHACSLLDYKLLRSEWVFYSSSHHLLHLSPSLAQRRYSVCVGWVLRMPEYPTICVHLQGRRLGSSPSSTAKSCVTLGKSPLCPNVSLDHIGIISIVHSQSRILK